MKNLIFALTCIAALLFTNQTIAQNANFSKGQTDINIGIGLFATMYGSGVNTSIPPVGFSLDKGITDKFSVGGYLGFSTAKSDVISFSDGTEASWKFKYIVVGARGSYHFKLIDKMDTYAGLMLGWNAAKATFSSNDPALEALIDTEPSAGGFTWAAHIGARYSINEKIGAFAELGYGVSVLTIGATIKL